MNTNTLFGISEKTSLEKGVPNNKIIFSLNYQTGKWGVLLRNTRYGGTATTNVVENPADTLYESFSPKILTDVNVSYMLKPWLTINFGANNVFDVYPDRLKNYLNTGDRMNIYSPEASPFGYYGGYYYAGLNFNF